MLSHYCRPSAAAGSRPGPTGKAGSHSIWSEIISTCVLPISTPPFPTFLLPSSLTFLPPPLQAPPDWSEILTYFRGSELQNYFQVRFLGVVVCVLWLF